MAALARMARDYDRGAPGRELLDYPFKGGLQDQRMVGQMHHQGVGVGTQRTQTRFERGELTRLPAGIVHHDDSRIGGNYRADSLGVRAQHDYQARHNLQHQVRRA